MLGTTWKKKANNQPIHPAMVEGVGGDDRGGGGRWEAAMPVTPDRLAVMAGARAAREKAEENVSSFGGSCSEEGSNCGKLSRPPPSAIMVPL